jgi:hypothetical protein
MPFGEPAGGRRCTAIMRTPALLVAGLALALGPAATASGKEIASVKACGAGGCRDVTALATHAALDGGPPTTAPDRAAPFFRLRIVLRAGGERVSGWETVYVPSARRLRGDDGTWMSPAGATLGELDRLVRGMEPLPAERLGLPRAARAPAPAAADGGPPSTVWAILAVGAAALIAGAALGTRTVVARRRGAVQAG